MPVTVHTSKICNEIVTWHRWYFTTIGLSHDFNTNFVMYVYGCVQECVMFRISILVDIVIAKALTNGGIEEFLKKISLLDQMALIPFVRNLLVHKRI